jgi:hypothetical protein
VDGTRTDLNPGEALFIPRRVIHGFSNEGHVDARFLAIISPGLMGSGYFKDVADVLGGDGPPDIESLARSCAVTALLPRHRLDRLAPGLRRSPRAPAWQRGPSQPLLRVTFAHTGACGGGVTRAAAACSP